MGAFILAVAGLASAVMLTLNWVVGAGVIMIIANLIVIVLGIINYVSKPVKSECQIPGQPREVVDTSIAAGIRW